MNLLITGAWSDGKNFTAELEAMGHNVRYMQFEKEELPCEYAWVEGAICNGLFLHHNIEEFKNLRYIQLTSAGFDRVPMSYVEDNSIEIHNARGVYSVPMAEFAVSGVLQIYKQASFFRENQKKHIWEKHRGLLELCEKKVLIIGCGSVGNECAKRFKAFECQVYGVDLFPREDNLYCKIFSLEQLNEVLSSVDIVVLTLPLTENTRHLLNEEKLSIMKQGSVLVNIARGAIVDMEALMDSLDKFGGMVLDVFEDEPLDDKSPLWDKINVIISPHNSFVGEGNADRLNKIIFKNLYEA